MEVARTCTRCNAPALTGEAHCESCRRQKGEFEQIPGGRYEIVETLGTGAFGSVYRAQDAFLSRDVAVKSIRLATTLDPEHRNALNKRFVREAQVAAQLHHPNIVTIHDIIFTPETGFIVMELVQGRTLQSLLKSERLPLGTAVEIAVQIGSALHYAHEHKVIHRDVKPANILITPRYEARITDFGIAKSGEASHLTMSGSLVGTPDYMSPEQAQGEDVDQRSDIFSLGCVLFECAVGAKPFRGGSLTGVLLSIVNSNPFDSEAWRSQERPAALGAVLERALAKDPAKRYETAEELVTALRGLDLSSFAPSTAVVPAKPKPAPADEPDSRTVILDLDEKEFEAGIEERLKSFNEEVRPLTFSTSASDALQEMSLTPAQGFILSRIDGASLARDILALSPMPEIEVAETLADLLDRGLLAWSEDGGAAGAKSGDSTTKGRVPKPAKASAPPPAPGAVAAKKAPLDPFDRKKYARELFLLAQKAYDITDYWEAIQLARQAIELDDQRPEYHHLLGLGLMKNRNWLKEAEECLRKASELDPTKAEYFGLLATVYKAEGLSDRSATMLEKAKSLDPGYC